MKKKLFITLLIVLLAGCADMPEEATPTAEAIFTIVPTRVVDDTPVEEEELPAYLPQIGDNALTKGGVITSSVYVLYSGTDPAEVVVHISGYLPTPCHQLRVLVPEPDENKDIYMEVYSLIPPNQLCEQVLRAFDVSVNIGSYPSGSYWVWINGGRAGNFDY